DVLFPVVANAPYLLKVRDLPVFGARAIDRRLTGDEAEKAKRDVLLNPLIIDRATGEVLGEASAVLGTQNGLPGHKRVTLKDDLVLNRGNKEAIVSFNISDIWDRGANQAAMRQEQARSPARIPCYQGPLRGGAFIQWPSNRAPDTCVYRSGGDQLLGSDLDVRAPIMLRITGDVDGRSSPEGEASIEIAVKVGSGNFVSYRGRRFDQGTGDASLVVRGTKEGTDGTSRYFDYCTDLGWGECTSHSEMAMVREGENISVKFSLDQISGQPLGWKLRHIDIFYPQFKFVKETASCGYSTSPNSCANSVAPMRPSYYSGDTSQPISSKQRPDEGTQCHRNKPNGYYDSSATAQSAIQALFASGQINSPTTFWARSADPNDKCAPTPETRACNDKYVEYNLGCDPTYTEQQMRAVCNLGDVDPQRDQITGHQASSISSDKKEIVGACKNPEFPACGKPSLAPKGERFFGASSNNCSEALSRSYSRNHGTYFTYNPYPGCPNPVKDIIDDVKKEIPPGIEPIIGTISSGYTYTPNRPVDRCVKYAEMRGIPGNKPIYCATNVSKPVAQRCCITVQGGSPGATCDVVPSGTVGFDGRNGGGAIDTDGAVARVIDTAQAAYPRAVVDMPQTEPNAINVQVATDDENTQRASITARINVPLMVLMNQGVMPVEYTESRAVESRVVGENF
ncbi:MAG: hypothetical protein ACK5Y6_08260, partial [Pseudomonadota bacterium]